MIVKQSTSKYTMITICNFESYQDNSPSVNHQDTSGETSSEQQGDTIEEEKEHKERKKVAKDTAEFIGYLQTHRGIVSCSDSCLARTPEKILVYDLIPLDQIEKDADPVNAYILLAKWMHQEFWNILGDSKNLRDMKLLEWVTEARLMLTSDGRSKEEILRVFKWAMNDSWWRTNFYSIVKFRKNYDQIKLQSLRNEQRHSA